MEGLTCLRMGDWGPTWPPQQFSGQLSAKEDARGGQHHPAPGPILLAPRGDPETSGGGGGCRAVDGVRKENPSARNWKEAF